jgi:hypothetical protein
MGKETIKLTLKPLLTWGAVAAVLAFVLVIGSRDQANAGTFAPTLTVTVEADTPESTTNFNTEFGIGETDVNFAAVVSYIPLDWGVVPGDQMPVGTEVGSLASDATLGLLNSPCNQVLPVSFTFSNSSLNRDDTVSFLDTDSNNTADYAEDKDGNGIEDAIDKYPDFLNRLFDEQPIRRSAGITLVAGIPVLLQFLIFEPGTVIDEALPSDESRGFPSVTVLQNAGDPDAEPQPGAITDFCSPLVTSNITMGTDPEGGPLFVTPQAGNYTFSTVSFGQRDADDDGYENALDTCALQPNVGNPRISNDGDADGDGLDAACDPNDDAASGGTDSDEDADGYQNRQDNCPLVPNGEAEDNQQDTDIDQIGDACDPEPDVENGELGFSDLTQEVVIGGGGAGGRPSQEACAPRECWEEGYVLNIEGGGGGDDDDDDVPTEPASPDENGDEAPEDDDDGGSNTGVIIGVVVAAIAIIAIIGGGLALMRRRNQS